MQAAHYSLGNLRLDIVSDGTFYQDAGGIFGLIPREMWEPLTGSPNARNRIPMALNCVLVRGGSRTVLIDNGAGNKLPVEARDKGYPGDYGHLLANLATLGVRPGEIDIVVNTHLHFDHCGWNTALVHGAAIPTFSNARYYVQRAEWDEAMHTNERTRATYLADNLQPVADAGLLELVEGEFQVTPEVRFLPTPGHTDGHAAIVLTSGGETAIYIGDIVQHAIQLERAPWVSAFDTLPILSMETKKRLVADAIAANALLISPHIPYPGAGRLLEVDGRKKWTAVAGRAAGA